VKKIIKVLGTDPRTSLMYVDKMVVQKLGEVDDDI
jgi:hypothetical protein